MRHNILAEMNQEPMPETSYMPTPDRNRQAARMTYQHAIRQS